MEVKRTSMFDNELKGGEIILLEIIFEKNCKTY
jgi:hypothetical protein